MNRRTPPGTFVQTVLAGHPYTACHIGFRHERNFTAGQVLSLDFDTEDEVSTIKHLSSVDFFNKYAYAIYTTASHTEDKPRARVVFLLQEPIKRPSIFSLAASGLVHHFSLSDPSCIDPARIFFGSLNGDVLFLNNGLPLSVLKPIIEKEIEKREADLQRSREEFEAMVRDRGLVTDYDIEESLRKAAEMIIAAPDGSRHLTRLKVGKLVGGWVAGNEGLSYSDALNYLSSAAQLNTSSPASSVVRDIKSGMDAGLSQPVVIESYYAVFPYLK